MLAIISIDRSSITDVFRVNDDNVGLWGGGGGVVRSF
jgi:hypothetical protein